MHIADVVGRAEGGGAQFEVYRWPGEDEEAEERNSDDEDGECETISSRRLNRLGGFWFFLVAAPFLILLLRYP